MVMLPIINTFTNDTPLDIRVRTNMNYDAMLPIRSEVCGYSQLGAGPAGQSNKTAWAAATPYTLTYSVARYTNSAVISVTFSPAVLSAAL